MLLLLLLLLMIEYVVKLATCDPLRNKTDDEAYLHRADVPSLYTINSPFAHLRLGDFWFASGPKREICERAFCPFTPERRFQLFDVVTSIGCHTPATENYRV